MFFYFLDINLRNCPIYAHTYQKFYLVMVLKTNLLVDNNILTTKRVIINVINKTTLILSYQVIIFGITWPRSQFV